MRTIKFRAWSPKLNKMSKPFSFGQILNFCDTNFKSLELDKEIVMQFTGMHDKSGKEIYEGDLIIGNTSYERSDDERIWTVDDPCEVKYWKDVCGFHPFTLNERWRCDLENVVVIGNIHENPELL